MAFWSNFIHYGQSWQYIVYFLENILWSIPIMTPSKGLLMKEVGLPFVFKALLCNIDRFKSWISEPSVKRLFHRRTPPCCQRADCSWTLETSARRARITGAPGGRCSPAEHLAGTGGSQAGCWTGLSEVQPSRLTNSARLVSARKGRNNLEEIRAGVLACRSRPLLHWQPIPFRASEPLSLFDQLSSSF